MVRKNMVDIFEIDNIYCFKDEKIINSIEKKRYWNLSPVKLERVPLKITMGLRETSDLTPERNYPKISKQEKLTYKRDPRKPYIFSDVTIWREFFSHFWPPQKTFSHRIKQT